MPGVWNLAWIAADSYTVSVNLFQLYQTQKGVGAYDK